MIQIGDHKHAIRTPKDLDERLIASTGCSAAEHAAMLAGQPYASHLARALHPFLFVETGEPVSVQELAEQIHAVGIDAVAPAVRALYAKRGEATDGGE